MQTHLARGRAAESKRAKQNLLMNDAYFAASRHLSGWPGIHLIALWFSPPFAVLNKVIHQLGQRAKLA
jgi:hypothetical protein